MNVAPDATVTALASAMRFAAPSCNVPALTVVGPVYVFAPVSVVVPLPCWISTPNPETTLASVTALLRLITRLPWFTTAPVPRLPAAAPLPT